MRRGEHADIARVQLIKPLAFQEDEEGKEKHNDARKEAHGRAENW